MVELALSDDPQVRATGHVRQVAPQADSATRTFQVKVGINNPPEGMRLGSTVTGRIKLAAPEGVEVPASALTEGDGRPAVWVVDRQSQTVSLRTVDVVRYDPAERRDLAGAREGRRRGHRRGADAAPGPEGPPAGRRLMNSFNLSEWALRHRSLVTYFMLMIVVAGIGDYFKLGRSEDPDFTVKTMVVAAEWPGATVDDTLEQITDRLERKLQETPSLDYVKSYTSAGRATIFVNLKDSTPPADVPDIWYQVRKKVGDIAGTLPQGVVGPDFDDEFGDTYGIVYGFTANGFTDRELRDYVHDVRKQLLELPDISKIDILGAQDERVYVEFSHEKLAGLGIDRSALIDALQSQNAVTPAGVVQTGDEKILVRVSGAFQSEQDVLGINFVANGRMIRLGDIARVTRGPADPAQPMFRVNGQQGIGIAIAMRKGGDVLALGHNVAEAMARITANLPVGIEPTLVANQTVTVEHAVDEFMKALWEAIAIVLGVSLLSLGLRAGAVVALSIPLVLAAVFVVMSFTGIDLQRISLGALIIALGLLVDDAMITVESMVTRLERGDDKEQRRHLRLHLDRLSDAHRHAGHCRRVRADRLRAQRGGRIHLLDLRRGRHRAARLLGRRGAVFAAARRLDPQEAQGRALGGARPDHARLPPLPRAGDALALDHASRHARPVRAFGARHALRAAAVLPVLRPARAAGRPAAARERVDLRHPRRLGSLRCAAEGRSRRRPLEHLCRAGAPCASICRSMCSCPTTSSPRPWSSPRDWSSASA